MFVDVLSQVIILLLLIFIGAALKKFNVLTESGIKSMTDMVLYIVTPCVIIKSLILKFDSEILKNILISFAAAALMHMGFIVLGRSIFRFGDEKRRRVLQFAVVFSNAGFMALPLQQALLGDSGVLYGSAYIAIFNLFIWSYGILLMSGDKRYLSPKKLILNPGMIGLSVGLIVFLLSVPIPKIIFQPINYIASLNTPLPMIIIGYHLACSRLTDGFKDLRCLLSIAIRLVIFPMLALGIMYLCGLRGDILVSLTIAACAPTAAITTMFSDKFSADTSLSVNIVSLSTLLSVATMPPIITLAQHLAG